MMTIIIQEIESFEEDLYCSLDDRNVNIGRLTGNRKFMIKCIWWWL